MLFKFFSCKEGPSFEGGIHLGWGAVSDNYGNADWLRDELFECFDAQIELQQNNVLFYILNLFELFVSQEHKEKGQKFANRRVTNIYFDNKRKLSTDSVMKDKVKIFKKDKERNNSK